jgi:hypothetical protein
MFGPGQVVAVKTESATINFDQYGLKTIHVAFARLSRL